MARSSARMKFISPIGSFIALLLGGALAYAVGPGGTGTLGALTMDDGTEVRVTQSYNNSITEPCTIDFFTRRPGEPWGWCYVEHEDSRWRDAKLIVNDDNRSVQIYRGSTLRAEYFLSRKTFAVYAEHQTEIRAPQENRDPPL